MASPRPTSGKPASTARHITASARDVFLTEGYEAASMDAIARQADVSKATLYAHFSSKETLFTAVMQEQTIDYAAALDQIASDPSGDLAQQLTRAGINLLTFLLSDAKLSMFRILFSEGSRIPEVCQDFIRTTRKHSFNRFADIFRNNAEAGQFTPQDCEEAARLFIAMLRGDLVWNCLVDPGIDPDDKEIAARVTSAVKLVMRSFSPSAKP